MTSGLSQSRNATSIRSQLLRWLIAPIFVLGLVGASVAYYFAQGFASDSYDHELRNSVDSVEARLKYYRERIWVDLPPQAQAILRHNDRDRFYYQVLNLDGTRIAGDLVQFIPNPGFDLPTPLYSYARIDGRDVRMVRIRAVVPDYPGQEVFIQAAETLNSRHRLARQILSSILLSQLFFVVLGGLAVFIAVRRGLSPLKDLEDALKQRSQADLTPVSDAMAPLEVKPLVVAINDLLARLRSDIESKQRFVADAAHQIRTPLAGLKTYMYTARNMRADPELKEVLGQVDAGVDRLVNLANKLLTLARTDPESKVRRPEKLDLNAIAVEAVDELVLEAHKRDIDLTFTPSDGEARILGESADLFAMISNLIENAVFYTQKGGHVDVVVKLDSHQRKVILSVVDDGPGIPEVERERVFERFYRVLGTHVPGSGLGLPIVKEIAIAHGAQVTISGGTGGRGTSVNVGFEMLST